MQLTTMHLNCNTCTSVLPQALQNPSKNAKFVKNEIDFKIIDLTFLVI